MRRTRLVTALLLAGALTLASCGGDEDAEEASEPGSPEEQAAQTWPLTGLPAPEGESVERPHPVLVVKMDNTDASSPQAGLGGAELVVEELVEGGLTRLAVFYYEELPGVVGPVRSMRASDIGIVSPVDATVVTSGAAGQTIGRIEEAGIEFVSEGAEGMSRDSARSAPYNLFADLGVIAEGVETDPARPPDYLTWADEGAETGEPDQTTPAPGRPARALDVAFSAGHTTTWEYQKGAYHNVGSHAAEGDEFHADTVLVVQVRVGDAGYVDPAGNPVPETILEGSGTAWLFHGGRVVRADWTKDALDAPLELATGKGALPVPPGRAWIELMPKSSGSLTIR